LQSSTATPAPAAKKEESSSEEETSSEEESETEEETKVTPPKPATTRTPEPVASSTRAGILRDTAAADTRRSSRDETSSPTTRSRYEAPSTAYGRTADKENDSSSRYGTRTRTTTGPSYEPEESR
jgi:tripartite motif-containing protein 71